MSLKNEGTMFKLLVKIGLGIGVLIVGIILIANMVTTVDADEIVVKQDLVGGELHVWNTPGVHWQNFGTITRYKRSAQFWFSAREDEGKKTDDAIKVRFNDGGHGNISGSLRYTLPLDPNKMLEVHKTFHSMKAIDHELIQQVVNKGVYMSGPLMSSRESYAEKRADLINYITDQIVYGVYRTEHEQVKTTDPLTQQEKTVDIVRPKIDPKSPNGVLREEESPIQRFGMSANNITVNSIEYDTVVEAQIKQQQEAINAVQQAIVNSKKAEQDAITVELQGKAAAAKAKWDQEVQKATAVTVAEQEKAVAVTQATKNKEVAALSLDTARLSAQETVTTAKAEADAKRLAMQSDNYQAKKIEATVEIQKAWAAAYGAQPQVPSISMGSNSSPTSTAMDAVAVRALRELNK
jgi:hypothetical protein